MKFPSVAISKWLGRLAPDRCRSVSLLLLSIFILPLQAAEEADPSQKLREQLRSVTLQLRTAQTDAANAQAAQAVAEKKITDLTAKTVELEKRHTSLLKQNTADKAASDETIAKLNNKLAEREKRIVEITENRDEWKNGYQKAAAVARTKEEERAKLAGEILVHKRDIADLQRKNIALFN
ncbi:MAG: hypothetical protein RLZZ214_1048, partial [Verrucomicrobiota bacterium]